MVEFETRLDHVFHALSDPTRRNIIASLQVGEKSVGELAAPFSMSLAGASKHVRVLEEAGLIHRRKDGRTHYCKLAAGPLKDAHNWLSDYAAFWSGSFDTLEQLLTREREENADHE